MSKRGPAEFKLERYFAKYEFHTRYMLSTSDPEPVTMSELLSMADQQCLDMWENLSLGYTESAGHPLLRQEIAGMYEKCTDDDVLVAIPQEGIYMAMKAMAKCATRGKTDKVHVVATYPAYQSLYEHLSTAGCDVSYWKAKWRGVEAGGWTFDMAELKALLRDDTRILVVNFPHNPTGFLPSHEEWGQIIQICKEHKMYLFSDEMYRLTNNDGTTPYPSACDLYENAITLFGLSKTFGLPGLRIGWLVTRCRELMSDMASFKDYLSICGSAPSEILAIIGLRNREKLLARTMSTVTSNLKLLEDFFAKHKDLFEWKRPSASTTTFLPLTMQLLSSVPGRRVSVTTQSSNKVSTELSPGTASALCHSVRKEAEILLLPAAMYDFPDKYIRLGFGRKNLPEAINALEKYLHKHVC